MVDHITDEEHSTCDTQSFTSEKSCPVCKLCTEEAVNIPGRGPFNKDKESPCAAHAALLSWVQESFEEEIKHLYKQGVFRVKSRAPYSLGFYRRPGGFPTIRYHDYKGRPQFSRKLLLYGPHDENPSGLHKHKLDPKWIDLQIARQWIDTCNKKHGSRCTNPFKAPPCYPSYLIDTKMNRLIQPGDKELEYVALSYRWGDRAGFKTDGASARHMMDPGGLCLYDKKIPPTIHHAMHVVRSIGERYLWVDSICLLSDDKKHIAEQLQLMGLIYARAKLTIVATDGDAQDGLHGIRGAPGKPRDLPNVFHCLNGMQITVIDRPSLSQVQGSASEYFRRGWTYQEYYLSQRRLIFGKKQIHWSCSCAVWHEDDPEAEQDPSDSTAQYFQIPNILSGKQDFEELGKLIIEYHIRDFTYPDDSLPGVTGLLTLLSRTFEGGFLCGHPEAWFDAALMWKCNFHENQPGGYVPKTILERREIAQQPSILPGAVLPSWSWISWKGNELIFLEEEEDFELPRGLIHSRWKYITTPITTWYSHETPRSDKRRIIRSIQQTGEVAGSLEDCSQGWVVEEYDPVRHPFYGVKSEVAGKRVYHHPTLPHRYFWRPFPKRNVGQDTSTFIPKPFQYISCHTKRGWFHIKPAVWFHQHWDLAFNAQFSLIDDLGRECGLLQVPPADASDLQRSYYHSLRGDEDKPESLSGFKVELVAVCRRRQSCPCWPSADEECHGCKEFYGVLWIEWTDGIAYRRGCGYVIKEMWDEHELNDVDLILG